MTSVLRQPSARFVTHYNRAYRMRTMHDQIPGSVLSAHCFSVRRSSHVSAVVVGGGPAGVAAVGSLLENVDGQVAWIDPEFKGGRINRKYREVPSNTKAALFLSYARAFKPFQDIVETTPKPDAVARLEELDQDATCSLHYGGDIIQMLTDGLIKHERVKALSGNVTDAIWDKSTSLWTVTMQDQAQNQQHREAPMLIFCTGSSPIVVPLPAPEGTSPPVILDLDTALKPSALAATLPTLSPTTTTTPLTIGVIGASHSAILVLMNLIHLAQHTAATEPPLHVLWFARSPTLRYARYLPDGTIALDNTGLKGRAAAFAREQLDGDALAASPAGRFVTRVDCSGGVGHERAALLRELPRCAAVVQAVGYKADEVPSLRIRGNEKGDVEVEARFDNDTGGFRDAKTGEELRGLFGAGIAFPERVLDPEGHIEYAVGMWKFVKFLKKVVPVWVAGVQKRA